MNAQRIEAVLDIDKVRPLVSIIISTYNRSNVLRYAVESVLEQTLTDWELLVVGDACSDDTDNLMQSFMQRDERISYHNRQQNFGEQSGPNNDGVRLSSGCYVAFLNHDDIWLNDHLEVLVKAIQHRSADMVFSLVDYLDADDSRRLIGATPNGEYEPTLFVPASSWLVKRETIEDVGPWRPARNLHNIPSQDWCFRAWKLRKKMYMVPILSVVAVPSGLRKNVYSDREHGINTEYFIASRDTVIFRQLELTNAAIGHSEQWLKRYSSGKLIKWAMINAARNFLCFLGIHPEAAKNFVCHPGRGGLIASLRKKRGLN